MRGSLVLMVSMALVLGAAPAAADEPLSARFSYQRSSDFFATGATMAISTDGDESPDTPVDPASVTVLASDLAASPTLQQALLYWGGSVPQPGADCAGALDQDVVLSWPGGTAAVTGDACFCSGAGAASYDVQACRADVTELVGGAMTGTWSVSGFDAQIADTSTSNASFSLVLIYGAPSLPPRQITVYDGLLTMANTAISLDLTGLAIDDPPIGDLTWYTLEGDVGGSNGERVEVYSTPRGAPFVPSDPLNPADNPMNRTINTTTPPQADVFGVDIDALDISAGLAAGDTAVTVEYSAGADKWWIAYNIVGVDVFFPSFQEGSSLSWAIVEGGGDGDVHGGDVLRVTAELVNGGEGNAVVTLRAPVDPLFSGVQVVEADGVDGSSPSEVVITNLAIPSGGASVVRWELTVGEVDANLGLDLTAEWSVPAEGTSGVLQAPHLVVLAGEGGDDDDSAFGFGDDDDGRGVSQAACGCATSGGGGWVAIALVAAIARRRRARASRRSA